MLRHRMISDVLKHEMSSYSELNSPIRIPEGVHPQQRIKRADSKNNKPVLYREIIDVFCEIHTNPINILCGLNVEIFNVKPDDTYSNHWALKD